MNRVTPNIKALVQNTLCLENVSRRTLPGPGGPTLSKTSIPCRRLLVTKHFVADLRCGAREWIEYGECSQPVVQVMSFAPTNGEFQLRAGEVSMGTSIMAVEFNGGVVMGADSRTTTGSYIANRVSDKITGARPPLSRALSSSSLLRGVFISLAPLNSALDPTGS